MFNIGKIIEEAKKVSVKAEEMQKKLDEVEVEGSAGGDFVKITGTAGYTIRRVEISDELFALNDKKMTEDLVTAAIADYIRKAKEKGGETTREEFGGMQLPPGFENLIGGLFGKQ